MKFRPEFTLALVHRLKCGRPVHGGGGRGAVVPRGPRSLARRARSLSGQDAGRYFQDEPGQHGGFLERQRFTESATTCP